MPKVVFTQNLQRHVACPPAVVAGSSVRAALEAAFALYPGLRSYVVDDQGSLRQHMVVFVDGSQIADRRDLSDPVEDTAEIYVMQALSGG